MPPTRDDLVYVAGGVKHTSTLAALATLFGGGVRPLGPDDLWCAFAIGAVYCYFYFCHLDRLGVHLYPIFSPRTHFCGLAYSVWVGLYVLSLRGFSYATRE